MYKWKVYFYYNSGQFNWLIQNKKLKNKMIKNKDKYIKISMKKKLIIKRKKYMKIIF